MPNPESTQSTVEVNDLDKFVRILTDWHSSKVATVRHLLEVPEGAAFQVGEGADSKEVVLTGEARAAFVLGVEMALMQLGELPFVAEVDDEPTPG